MERIKLFISFWIVLLSSLHGHTQTIYPATKSDYVIHDFKFESGESLAELTIHYASIGQAIKDGTGKTVNAVLIMHGTSGNGENFLAQQFAGRLFNPGQVLDSTKYFIILPDAIGHGKSSKPSNGMHMRFPKYTYNDMVKATYQLLTEYFGVNHLRLVMGTSMGGMHTWVWAYTYPHFMDALLPLACLPVEIAGRNRMWRKMAITMAAEGTQQSEGRFSAGK